MLMFIKYPISCWYLQSIRQCSTPENPAAGPFFSFFPSLPPPNSFQENMPQSTDLSLNKTTPKLLSVDARILEWLRLLTFMQWLALSLGFRGVSWQGTQRSPWTGNVSKSNFHPMFYTVNVTTIRHGRRAGG